MWEEGIFKHLENEFFQEDITQTPMKAKKVFFLLIDFSYLTYA